jgi:hypothetical protein
MYGRISNKMLAYQNCNSIIQEESGAILFLGDFTAAMDLNLLDSKNIKTVLTVAAGLPVTFASTSGIFHKTYNALDLESYNLSKFFSDTYN